MKQTLDWQIASIKDIKPETANVKSFTLTLPAWMRHRAGQHYDIRLTAEDGYQAQRSYSIASEPEREGEVDITVERINDGEVSTYLHDVLIPGDRIEARSDRWLLRLGSEDDGATAIDRRRIGYCAVDVHDPSSRRSRCKESA